MQDHIPYLTLSEVVKELCLAMFNDKRKYYINYMVHAKWIYKDLLLKSIFLPKSKYVKVDKTTNPWSIVVPVDMYRFLNLSKEDADGSLISFVFDNTINDVPLPTGTNACETCNEVDVYGQCFNNITVVTKEVVIDGDPYTEKIWKKLCPNGDVMEVREIPTRDFDADGEPIVTTHTQERVIANLELKTCGCVKKTERNIECVKAQCGTLLPSTLARLSHPTNNKVGTRVGRIKISQGRIWIAGHVPDYLILSYQTNGVCGESEIMVPEYAVSALLFGTKWRSIALATNQNPNMVRASEIAYESQVEKMDMFLNPIRVEEFMNVQMVIPKWGSEIDQSSMKSGYWYNCENICQLDNCTGFSADEIASWISKYGNEVVLVKNYEVLDNGRRVYIQEAQAMQMLIVHNLGYNPQVTATFIDGGTIDGGVSYPVDNISVLIKFSSPVAAKIYLS